MSEWLANRDALITGAGGFIGSALVRELCSSGAGSVVALDFSEHALTELKRHLPGARVRFVLGSVDDRGLVRELLQSLRDPALIHAAAYKHVPFLEHQLLSAVRNNALATYSLARVCVECGVSRFLYISTDKAANPCSVMGMSKRAAELLVLSCDQQGFSALRLGNVLGSPGSVIPVWRQQAAEGRPLTVTDPEASRYFYTLPETVAIVLDALQASGGGHVLLPPIKPATKIGDLARSLYPDSEVDQIGLRPGEKLHEEFLARGESPIEAFESGITPVQGARIPEDECNRFVTALEKAVSERDATGTLSLLRDLVRR